MNFLIKLHFLTMRTVAVTRTVRMTTVRMTEINKVIFPSPTVRGSDQAEPSAASLMKVLSLMESGWCWLMSR